MAIARATALGYGDIYPVTGVGRAAGVATMVVGISAFAVGTAKVAEFLVRADVEALADNVSQLVEAPEMTHTTGSE